MDRPGPLKIVCAAASAVAALQSRVRRRACCTVARRPRVRGRRGVVTVDKADITPELVSRLVARQFPQWGDLPVSRVELDGWDNATFRLGTTMSVRLPSGDAYVAQIDKEHRWLPILRGDLPLSIPEPLVKG